MYHVVDDLKKVQRFGRWHSDTFHIYLWESHEPMRPVAKGMAEDRTELTKPVAAAKRGMAEQTGKHIETASKGLPEAQGQGRLKPGGRDVAGQAA